MTENSCVVAEIQKEAQLFYTKKIFSKYFIAFSILRHVSFKHERSFD
jgi:hypothetical protein